MKILNETRLAYLVTKIRSLISGKQDKIALPNDATMFYNGKGQFAVPPDTNTTYDVTSTAAAGLAPKLNGTATTYLNGAGQWATPPNTDTNVAQNHSTGNAEYPILAKNGTGTGNVTSTALFDGDVTINPSTGTVTAPVFKGSLTGNASSATKATTADSATKADTATTAGNVTGTVAIANGGTGATTAKAAMSKLGGLFTGGAWDELPANANLNAAPYINSGQWCHRANVAYTGGPSGLTEWFQLLTIESYSDGNARTRFIFTLSGRLFIQNITSAGADSYGGWKEFGTGSVGKINTNGNSSQFLRGDGTWGAAGSDLVEVTDAEIDAVLALI